MTKMILQDPFEIYKKYIAVKLHFSSNDYNYHTYGGKVSANLKSFQKRKDRALFEYLSRSLGKHETVPYFVAQIVYSNNLYIADLLESVEKTNRVYDEWIERMRNLRGNFKRDLGIIKNEFNKKKMFKVEDQDDHPFVFKLFIRRIITPESYCLLDSVSHHLDVNHCDPLVTSNNFKMKKYRYFIKLEESEILEIATSD